MKNIWKDPNRPQVASLQQSLYLARVFMAASRGCATPAFKQYLKVTAYAFINRACELACAPVHLHPVETSNGLDLAWYTYRPVARKPQRVLPLKTKMPTQWRYQSVPCEIESVYLGLERDLTEDQARNKAMGW